MTPYTSYLVLEYELAYKQHNIPRPSVSALPAGRMGKGGSPLASTARTLGFSRGVEMESAAAVPIFEAVEDDDALSRLKEDAAADEASTMRVVVAKKARVEGYLKSKSGKEAIQVSESIQEYRRRDKDVGDRSVVRHIGDRLFTLIGGRWVDSKYKKEMKSVKVAFASEAYFKLLEKHPDLKPCFALGERVTIVLDDGTAIVVGE